MIYNIDSIRDAASDILGWTGTVMAVSFPFLDGLQQWAQTIGAIGGVILLWITIVGKLRQNEIKKIEIKKLKKEIEDETDL